MPYWSQDAYLDAWNFAAKAHGQQPLPGTNLPYINHVGSVAMEVLSAIALRAGAVAQPDLCVQCALLHDVLEDTDVDLATLEERFGPDVAAGVLALTKNPAMGDKPAQMADSLARIRLQPPEVWMVKLGDRITNLQSPPSHWAPERVVYYRSEAERIHEALASACPILGPRLRLKIDRYL